MDRFEPSRPPHRDDPRIARTRAALVGAFNRLLLARGYEAITPATIAAAAGVARSTFYEHYAGKPALLKHVLQRVLQPLADAVDAAAEQDALTKVVVHFADQRRLARTMLVGRSRVILQTRLAELVEENLRRSQSRTSVPLPMAAAAIAHAQLALLDAWLSGRHRCDAAALAAALRTAALALRAGFDAGRLSS